MPEPEYLFVYGTLRRGMKNEFARRLAANSEFLGEARIAARLYDIGPYRAAVLSSEAGDWVRGEVFQLNDPDEMFAILDQYEGSDFERLKVQVLLDSGAGEQAWVYLYTGRLG